MQDGGGLGSERFYFAPKGLISPDELPEGWGLLELKGGRVYRKAESVGPRGDLRNQDSMRREIRLLSSCVANVQRRDRGESLFVGKHAEHNLGSGDRS